METLSCVEVQNEAPPVVASSPTGGDAERTPDMREGNTGSEGTDNCPRDMFVQVGAPIHKPST